ncbi:unnamed protein product [Brassica rapa]|uniref:Uncharacterized protein n=1 Tax=Brassica campestris TaxID=3711 RepID=A0A8D9GB86_BRACM|nr:unnamed protein product [Brassica rapa]
MGCLFSTHRTSIGVRQHTQDFRQQTQDVLGCPCVSVGLSVCVLVCPSAHTRRSWLSISTHISTLVLGLNPLALPVDCSDDFGQRGLSVQYTQDVCGCPSAHIGCSCVSVSTHRMSVAVRVCQCLFVSTHRTSVAVHQYTYRHLSPWTQHADPSHGLFVSTHSTSVGVCQHTQDIRGCSCLSVSTHRTSVAVHHVRPCVSVCVRQHTQDVRGCPSVYISARWSLDSAHCPFPWIVRVILAHVGCLFSTHRTSYTQDVRGCPPAHTGCLWLSVCVHHHTQDVCGCPSVYISAPHTKRPWVSVSTHRTSVALSVFVRQHTQDVRGCPSVHISALCVRVCLCVSVSTHRTSVALHQYTYQHAGPWTQHTVPSRGLFG